MKTINIIAIAIIILASSVGVQAETRRNLEHKRTVVYEMFTFQCENCGYVLAEGEYSYIDHEGFEQCKECGLYRNITSPRD